MILAWLVHSTNYNVTEAIVILIQLWTSDFTQLLMFYTECWLINKWGQTHCMNNNIPKVL